MSRLGDAVELAWLVLAPAFDLPLERSIEFGDALLDAVDMNNDVWIDGDLALE